MTNQSTRRIFLAGAGSALALRAQTRKTFDVRDFVTFDRWTKYSGAVFDNRPTTAYPDVEPHNTPGISVRYTDGVALNDCTVSWGTHCPPTFTEALETENVTGLTRARFKGTSARTGVAKRFGT